MATACEALIAFSTGSLHRALGVACRNVPANDVADEFRETCGPARIDLFDLPAALREDSVGGMETVPGGLFA
jgi:hypothetical protein